MELERIDCAICERDEARDFLTGEDLKEGHPGQFRLVQCRRCGLIYMNPRPTRESMGGFYAESYWGAPAGAAEAPPTRTGRLILDRLCERYPGGRVLDVGCGVGVRTAQLRARGLRAVGIDPSEHASRTAGEQFGLPVAVGALDAAPLREGSLDAVTFLHVIEHLHDPLGDLQRARGLLKPGGAVFVEAPNIGSLQARCLGRWWYGLDLPRHLFHFTPQTLRNLLDKAGFSEIRCQAVSEAFAGEMFEISFLRYLRSRFPSRRGDEQGRGQGAQTAASAAPEAAPAAPGLPRRAFRWLVRRVVYAPLAVEAWLGRSVLLFGSATK